MFHAGHDVVQKGQLSAWSLSDTRAEYTELHEFRRRRDAALQRRPTAIIEVGYYITIFAMYITRRDKY